MRLGLSFLIRLNVIILGPWQWIVPPYFPMVERVADMACSAAIEAVSVEFALKAGICRVAKNGLHCWLPREE